MKLLDLADLSSGPGRALLEATCAMGFSEPVARAGLEAELGAWRSPGAIAGVLRELPPDLDPRRRPREVLVIAARTLPVSAMRAVLMARLLGARVRLKSSSGQETLGEILQAVDPGIVATPFASDEEDALQAHLDEVDAVVVLGEDSTLDAVRAATPDGCAFIGYGHKVSAAWLDRTDQTTARALALDLCAWDQSGCLSPQVAWVSGEPETFLARLAEEIEAVESSLPMDLPEGARHARAIARTTGEMLGEVAETRTALLCALPAGPFRPSPGFRALWLLPQEAAGPAGLGDTLSSLACTDLPPPGLHPHVRRCAPGELQRPPLGWPHDGRPNLLPMLREI